MAKKKVDLNTLGLAEQIALIKVRPSRYNEITAPCEALQMYMLSFKVTGCTSVMLAKMSHDVLTVAAMNPKLHNKLSKIVDQLPHDIKLLCAEANSGFIKYLANVDSATALTLVQRNPGCLAYFKEQTEEMQMVVVRSKMRHWYRAIRKPSEKIQLAMVKRSAFNLDCIPNACDNAKWLAIQTYEKSKITESSYNVRRHPLKSLIKRPSPEMKAALILMA